MAISWSEEIERLEGHLIDVRRELPDLKRRADEARGTYQNLLDEKNNTEMKIAYLKAYELPPQ